MEEILHSLFNIEKEYSPVLQFLMMMAVSIIPFAPVPVIATVIGANNCLIVGILINLFGTVSGSIILYLLSKNLLRQYATKILCKYKKFEHFIFLVQTNGFIAVLIGRLVPIIPSAGVNLIAGISGVSILNFALATILGKLPMILTFSIAGNHLAVGNWSTVILGFLYIFLIVLIRRKLKKRWYIGGKQIDKTGKTNNPLFFSKYLHK